MSEPLHRRRHSDRQAAVSDRQRALSDRQRLRLRRRLRGFGVVIGIGLLALVAAVWWRLQEPALAPAPAVAPPPDPESVAQAERYDEPIRDEVERLPSWMRPGEAIELGDLPPVPDPIDRGEVPWPDPPPIRGFVLMRDDDDELRIPLEDGGRYGVARIDGQALKIRVEIDDVPELHLHLELDGERQLENDDPYDLQGNKLDAGDILPGRHALFATACIAPRAQRGVREGSCTGTAGPRHKLVFRLEEPEP